MLIPNLISGRLISTYCSSSIVFHDQQDSLRHENRRKSITPGTCKTGKLFFFFHLLSSDKLASTLPQSLTMVFTRNISIFNRAVQQPIAFSQPPSLHQAAAAAHSITMALFVTPFSHTLLSIQFCIARGMV